MVPFRLVALACGVAVMASCGGTTSTPNATDGGGDDGGGSGDDGGGSCSCPAGTSCQGGSCVCAGGLTLCASGCVDVETDPTNCGGCGVTCAGRCTPGGCFITK